jgi:hypothetical protein
MSPHALGSLPEDDVATTTGGFARSGDGELVLLANSSMRARRAPLAILWLWGFQTILASLAAWPFTALVTRTYGLHPRGDAPIWKPGALALADLADALGASFAGLMPLPLLTLAVAAIAGLFPLALLLGQMTYATRSKRSAPFSLLTPHARRAFTPLLVVLASASVVQVVVVAAGLGVGGVISSRLASRVGEAPASQYGGLATLFFVFVATVLGVLHDLARAAVVRFNVSARYAARLAWNTFRRGPVVVYWSWAWRGLVMLGLVIIGSIVAEKSKNTASSAIVPLFVLHQSIILGRLTFRASWLARAVRAVDAAHRVVGKSSSSSRGPSSSSTPQAPLVTDIPAPARAFPLT